jgi:hypothetical protein
MESGWLPFAAAGATLGPVDSVWIFLAPGCSAAKTHVYEGWKGLDFLGFSRQNLAFSMGYTGSSLKEISRALFAAAPEPWERQLAVLACGRAGSFMGQASLTLFLISCKNSSSELFLSGRLDPKATRSRTGALRREPAELRESSTRCFWTLPSVGSPG